jgi:hypothetical protein
VELNPTSRQILATPKGWSIQSPEIPGAETAAESHGGTRRKDLGLRGVREPGAPRMCSGICLRTGSSPNAPQCPTERIAVQD